LTSAVFKTEWNSKVELRKLKQNNARSKQSKKWKMKKWKEKGNVGAKNVETVYYKRDVFHYLHLLISDAANNETRV